MNDIDKTLYLDFDKTESVYIGKDPRKLSEVELEALPHETSVIAAVRAKCMDCCYSSTEVRKCVAVDCALWPFRMGKNVFSKKRLMVAEQREKISSRMKKLRGAENDDSLSIENDFD